MAIMENETFPFLISSRGGCLGLPPESDMSDFLYEGDGAMVAGRTPSAKLRDGERTIQPNEAMMQVRSRIEDRERDENNEESRCLNRARENLIVCRQESTRHSKPVV